MTPKARRPTVVSQAMLRVADVAALLNVSESMVYKLAKRKQLKAVEVGESLRFWPDEVEEYLQARRTMPGKRKRIKLAVPEEAGEGQGEPLAVGA